MARRHPIPTEALDQHIAVLGKTGSGKTYAVKGIVERLLNDGRQVCILDPTAAWWGLRLGSDGRSKGYDVVLLGGTRGDLPLSDRSGEPVARLVTQQHANVVADLSGLVPSEQCRWFIDFAETLYKTLESPLHLVIDEAHLFMPQSPMKEATKALNRGNRLMAGGRSLGIRGVMITQRPAKFHKDCLTCADTLVAMRVLAPQDRKAVKEWVDGAGDPDAGKEVLGSLASLAKGDAWVWYPEGEYLKRATFPEIKTYDSSAAPKHGGKAQPSVREIDLTEVRRAMADAVKDAEANDPKLLRAENAKLKRQIAGQTPVIDDAAIAKAVAARDREWESKVKEIERVAASHVTRLGKIRDLASLNGEATDHRIERPGAVISHTPPRSLPAGGGKSQSTPIIGPGGKRRILIALAQRSDDRVPIPSLGALTGLSTRSGTWGTYLSDLRSSGFVEGGKGEGVQITRAGIAALGSFDPLPTGDRLRIYWRNRLGDGGIGRMFEVICDAYPHALSNEEIGACANLSHLSGTFGTYRSKLVTMQLIEKGAGGYRAVDALFE